MFIDPDGREAQGCCGNLWNLAKTYYSGMYQGVESSWMFNAGNNLLLNNPSAIPSQINFTDAIRPRTGKVVPRCDNCKTTFGK
ncbi:hypothetical protein EG344_23005 [Chryseobacterium sp. G0162]|uniref:hypothetical protein n=1 Tax=Chryseobacterium sp. G0162 TaxID=2487063 RepID=UPI000F4E6A03|nr:hypothetical protein [Chryseobacterium sp. G0162]AZB11498.1 hypothetical protein EG344_23005 [Chryseobacterium sp. G0162]